MIASIARINLTMECIYLMKSYYICKLCRKVAKKLWTDKNSSSIYKINHFIINF